MHYKSCFTCLTVTYLVFTNYYSLLPNILLKKKKNHPSPQEISKRKPDTILMLNSEQYILAGLLRIHVHSFGYSQQFTRSVTLIT